MTEIQELKEEIKKIGSRIEQIEKETTAKYMKGKYLIAVKKVMKGPGADGGKALLMQVRAGVYQWMCIYDSNRWFDDQFKNRDEAIAFLVARNARNEWEKWTINATDDANEAV